MATILIIDDEEDIRDLVSLNLARSEPYDLVEADNGLTGVELAKERRPDLIILDVMMPDLDGYGVLKELKSDARTENIPVIMLTAKGKLEDKLDGLETGVDDYLPKPFSPKELVLRVRNLLRRASSATTNELLEHGAFCLDRSALKLLLDGEEVDLTITEFKLLLLLLESPGLTQERGDLLQKVWGYSDLIQTRTLDTHIKRLREKLGPHGNAIQTIRGVGYCFLLTNQDSDKE